MKCTKCGSEIQEGASFCTACGMPVMEQTSNLSSEQNPVNSSNEVPNLFDNSENGSNPTNEPLQNNVLNNQNETVNNQGNNKKTPVGLIIGVVVAAIVIIAIFAGISMSNDNTNDKTPKTNDQTNTAEKNDKGNQVEEKTQTVTYSDYNFTVPADFKATPSTSQLLITSSDNNLAEAIIYQSGTGYDTLASMKDQIVSLLQAQENSETYDFTNAVTTEKTYGSTQFLITSGIKQGSIDLDITYAETDGGVFVVSIAKTGGLITEAERQELYAIVASAN